MREDWTTLRFIAILLGLFLFIGLAAVAVPLVEETLLGHVIWLVPVVLLLTVPQALT